MAKYDRDGSGTLDFLEFVIMFSDTSPDAVFKLKLPESTINAVRKLAGGVPE